MPVGGWASCKMHGELTATEADLALGPAPAVAKGEDMSNSDASDIPSEARQKIADLRKSQGGEGCISKTGYCRPSVRAVQNLKFFTVGGVIKAGAPLLEIVPERDRFIVSHRAESCIAAPYGESSFLECVQKSDLLRFARMSAACHRTRGKRLHA
jgi:hypothetical protein